MALSSPVNLIISSITNCLRHSADQNICTTYEYPCSATQLLSAILSLDHDRKPHVEAAVDRRLMEQARLHTKAFFGWRHAIARDTHKPAVVMYL